MASSMDEPENPYQRHIDAYRRVCDRATKRLKLQHDSLVAVTSSVPAQDPVPGNEDISSEVSSQVSSSSSEPSDESSSSSGGDDDADDNDCNLDPQPSKPEEITNLRANRGAKPVMRIERSRVEEEESSGIEGKDIRSFLKDFLPKLKAANEELEEQRKEGTLETAEFGGAGGEGEEDDEDGQQPYIEMNLDLGVLEAKGDDASDSSVSEDENSGVANDSNVLEKLLGRRPTTRAAIQEVADGPQPT